MMGPIRMDQEVHDPRRLPLTFFSLSESLCVILMDSIISSYTTLMHIQLLSVFVYLY